MYYFFCFIYTFVAKKNVFNQTFFLIKIFEKTFNVFLKLFLFNKII